MEIDDGRQPVEFAKCCADAAYFTDSYLLIDDAQGDGGGSTRFRLWPAQVRVMWTLMQYRLAIVLKARQLGISWVCCAFVLWHCMFQPGKLALLFSQGEDEANEMLRRVAVLYARLPAWLRERCPLAREPNTTEIHFASGSRVKSFPAGRNSGSGWTASLVVMDEAAKLVFADDLYTAVKPTIDNGGQLIMLSTAKGVGNLFHRLWTKAAAGKNAFTTIFLPWWSRPERDAAWYERMLAESDDPEKVHQEYPRNPNEAFIASGRVRFRPDWIAAQSSNVRDPIDPGSHPESLRKFPGIRLYELPRARPAIIGADVAEGIEGGDYSDASLIDSETWEELASFNGTLEPDEFAELLDALSDAYAAGILVERNNHGHAVLSKLRSLGNKRVLNGHDGKRGWLTNAQTKPQMMDGLAAALRDGLAIFRTQAALDEMQVYAVLANGSTGAPPSYHDDRVMSRGIAIAGCTICRPTQARPPRTASVRPNVASYRPM